MAVVLFTDLVGSTELRGRLGEEAADELRRRHDQLVTQAVESYNGRVIKGLGDGIMATFAGASDAVEAAVTIQQAIDRLNRTGKIPMLLEVRIGLSAGDVAFEEDDVHGTPVIEASRLCGAALGGEILASEIVRWLGGAQGAPLFVPVGSLDLKGLAVPVPTVRIQWDPALVSSIPMPALLTDIGRIFVGRDAELERLQQLWKEAAAGERHVAFLAGEPGVGKTRLAAELAIRVHDEGGVVLAGRCDEDMGVPYQPFVEALHHFVEHTSPSELKERLGRYAGELVRLLPDLSEQTLELPPPLQSDPETERYRLFDAVAAWLSAASADDALVLVVDDLQWAAKPTLLLLRHIARAPDTNRLLILGTYRDTELTLDHPLVELMADLRRDGVLERCPLSGLDDSSVTAIVEQAAGHALDQDGVALARAIYRETEGNPFFVREVLRHLAETKAVERHGDRWATRVPMAELGIPEGVRDVIGRRLCRLSSDANHALRIAAVIGAEFEVDVVQAAGGLGETELLTALDDAVDARLISEVSPTRFRFSHALVRTTLYESLSGARRVALHRHVAQAIEALHERALDDHLPALAHHWARASAPTAHTAKAVDYARRAGDRALAQLAHDEAADYYQQALELSAVSEGPPHEDQRIELLIAYGEAQRRSGDPHHRETFLEAADLARRTRNARALARAALGNNSGFYSATGGVDRERVAALEAALNLVGEGDGATRARLLATIGLELVFSSDRRRAVTLSNEAVRLARDLGDPETLAHVLIARYYTTLGPDTLSECSSDTVELMQVVQHLTDPALQCRAYMLRQRTAMATGDVPEADRCLQEASRLADDLGQPLLQWQTTYLRAGEEIMFGRLAAAETSIRRALELGRAAGRRDADWAYAIQLSFLQLTQDRVTEDARRLLTAAVGQLTDDGGRIEVLEAVLAVVSTELGYVDEARSLINRLTTSPPPRDLYWITTLVLAAAAATRLGHRAYCQAVYAQLLPYASEAGPYPAFPRPPVAYYLGLLAADLGRTDEAEQHFASATTIEERLGATCWLARTRLEWARMLLTRAKRGDAERARELLGQALATARERGLANLERRAVELLQ